LALIIFKKIIHYQHEFVFGIIHQLFIHYYCKINTMLDQNKISEQVKLE